MRIRADRLGCALLTLILHAAPCAAQDPRQCEQEYAAREARWAQTAPHLWLSNVWEIETREIARDWCRTRNTQSWERVHNAESVGREVFTGDGLHPTVGTIAPGNGLAAGAAWNLTRASQAVPIRFAGSVEARSSVNRSWAGGGRLEMVGSAPRATNDHTHATLEVTHDHVNEVGYFGPGNASAVSDETRFGVDTTVGRLTVESVSFHDVSVFGLVEVLHARPGPFSGDVRSIETRFTDAEAPGLFVKTTYVALGGGATWNPDAGRSQGYRKGVTASFRVFDETGGQPYSFRQAEAEWTQAYSPPDVDFDFGTLSAAVRLVVSAAAGGDRIPFYLQPTLGGADFDGRDGLRGYRDYRFRAPDLLVAHGEYERTLHDPFGLVLFADVGRVADRRSDLDLGGLRGSLGVGVTLRAGNRTVVRLYYAWGGEGSRGSLGGNSSAFGGSRGAF